METGNEWWRATEPIVLKPQNNSRGLQVIKVLNLETNECQSSEPSTFNLQP
jgi:hypothetical protein